MVPIADTYLELLATEGYRPHREEGEGSTDIVFKSEGAQYRLTIDDADRDFVALSVCYGLEEGISTERLLQAANAGNEYWKVVKVTVHPAGEAVRFQFEAFGKLTPEILQRALYTLASAAHRFFEEIKESVPAKAKA